MLASAGHLPPYLNSQEILLPGGLPLGAIPENTYDEVSLYLHPGDRLLLLSDGVVEARKPSGELFGFDRVHNLSNQSAFYIADAAKGVRAGRRHYRADCTQAGRSDGGMRACCKQDWTRGKLASLLKPGKYTSQIRRKILRWTSSKG